MQASFTPTIRMLLVAQAAAILTLFANSTTHAAGVLYANPGWGYAYEGAEAYYNDPDGPNPDYINGNSTNEPGGRSNTAALEFPGFVDPNCNPNTTACAVKNDTATWIHSGSQWDGSAPGDPLGGNPGDQVPIPPAAPGGVETYTVGGTSYLRIQDAGNPQSWGWADKDAQASLTSAKQEGNNRRIQFAHKIERDAAYSGNSAVLDNGITIAFRTRLATAASGPLDPFLSEDGPATTSPVPWPVDGKGYPVSNNGRGMFMVTQNGASGPGQIAFSLLDTNTINDQNLSLNKTGLVFNNKSGGPDTNDSTADTQNIVEVQNAQLTEWQEFWITIKQLAAPLNGSTHEVSVYHNGLLTPQIFPVVLGNQNEFGNGPHLGLGLSSGTRWGAFDVDYFAYKEGVFAPQLANTPLAGDYNDDNVVDAADYTIWRDNLNAAIALPNETVTPGTVTIDDYNAWKVNFGATAGSGGLAGTTAVPEPATLSLLGLAIGVASVTSRSRGTRSKFHILPGLLAVAAVAFTHQPDSCSAAETRPPTHASLQARLDEAPARSVVDFAMSEFVTLDKPLRVTKPLTVRGLRLQLPPKLARTQLLQTNVEGFELTDSHFRGNADTVGQDQRASLVEVRAGKFRVERCTFDNASKNGLTIDPGDSDQPLVGGVVRDIVGHGVVRDVVSLSGGSRGGAVRDILVENVYAADSPLRGAVEVSDRSWDVTVRGVTAERCVYAIDVQDHDLPTDINRNVLLEDIRARNCRHAVRTATDPIGHSGLTIRNVVAEDCDVPLRIDHISDVLIDGVRIIGRQRDATEPEDLESVIRIKGCANVSLRDITVNDLGDIPAVIRAVDTQWLRIDGLVIQGNTDFEELVQIETQLPAGGTNDDLHKPTLRNIHAPGKHQEKTAHRTADAAAESSQSSESSSSTDAPTGTGSERSADIAPPQYAPPEAYLPGEKLPYFGSEDPWFRTKKPSPGARLFQAQQVHDLVNQKTQKALQDSRDWIRANKDDSDEARFYHIVALAQSGELRAADEELNQLLDLGFPPGRFLAGPRELTVPLEQLASFQQRVVEPVAALVHGPQLGSVTSGSAGVWVRTARESKVEVEVYPQWAPDEIVSTGKVTTSAESDFTGVATISGLQADTRYQYRISIDGRPVPRSDEWAFRTAPKNESDAIVRIAFGGCADYTPANERIWDTIRTRQPDAFVTLGDNVYIDQPGPVTAWHRQAYYRRQSRPEWRRLTAGVPVHAIWDDHDVGVDDVFLGPYVDRPAWKTDQLNFFRQQWNNPFYGAEPAHPGVWSSFRRGQVEVFLLDGRFYRENYLKPKASMLGTVQKTWLLQALKKSTARFKVIASPVAWADDAKSATDGEAAHDTWFGYRHERDEIFDFINAQRIDGVLLLAGDRHRSDVRVHERERGYPLYEFESSRLTNEGFHEPHGKTLFVYTAEQSFGLLTFDFGAHDPLAVVEIINIDGQSVYEQRIPLREVSHAAQSQTAGKF